MPSGRSKGGRADPEGTDRPAVMSRSIARAAAANPTPLTWTRGSTVGAGVLLPNPGGKDSDLGAAGQMQFAQHVGHMVLHRFLGHEHSCGDLLVGQAFTNQLQGGLFMIGQLGQRVGRRRWRCGPYPVEQDGRCLRVQQRAAGADRADRRDQIQPGDVLVDASPTTTSPPAAFTSSRTPRRTTCWSSTTNTLSSGPYCSIWPTPTVGCR